MAPMKSTTFVISNRFFHTAFIGYHSEFFQIRIFRIQNIIIIHSTPLHSTPIFLLVRGSPVDTSNQYGYVEYEQRPLHRKTKAAATTASIPHHSEDKSDAVFICPHNIIYSTLLYIYEFSVLLWLYQFPISHLPPRHQLLPSVRPWPIYSPHQKRINPRSASSLFRKRRQDAHL